MAEPRPRRAAAVVLLLLGLLWSAPSWAATLDLDGLIQEAVENNPDLTALRHRVAAFEARVPQAGALDDPMLKFEASNLPLSTFDYDSTPMTGNQLVLSQSFPVPGTLAASERAARHAAAAAEAVRGDRELAVTNAVKQAYFGLAFLDRAIEVTAENEDLLQDFVRIAQTKYAVGKGLQQDVLKAQVALSALRSRLIELRRKRKTAEARLNLVLNRDISAQVGRPPEVRVQPVGISLAEAEETALSARPALAAARETVEQWRATEAFARKSQWPRFTLSFGYRQRMDMPMDPVNGSDFVSFGVGMNLPLFQGRKQRQKVVEAQSNRLKAESDEEAVRQQIRARVRIVYDEIAQHADQANLFRTAVLPQAEQSLASARSGYQVDKVDFLTLLNNQMTLLNHRIEYYMHVTEHEMQRAELEAAIGRALR